MQTITQASVTEAGQRLRSYLVAYCTSGALVVHPAERALVGEHDLITGQLTVAKAQAIIEYCELNGHTLGGWLEALICWVADCAQVAAAEEAAQVEATQVSPAITVTATFNIGKGKTETVVGHGANLPAAKLALVDAYDEYLNGFACHAVYDASMATIAKKGIMAYLRNDPCCTVTITDNTATPASRFLARQQFVRELAELLQIGTDVNGSLVFNNPARDVQFFDQLAQYDAENSI